MGSKNVPFVLLKLSRTWKLQFLNKNVDRNVLLAPIPKQDWSHATFVLEISSNHSRVEQIATNVPQVIEQLTKAPLNILHVSLSNVQTISVRTEVSV